jgi:thioredoxin-like negative regulator of GroEL
MKYLETQEEFEEIMKSSEPRFTAIYFGAVWCGPCKRIDLEALEATGIEWLKCDVDMNNYTAGYCGIRSIPSFMVVANGEVKGPFQGDTAGVIEWVKAEHAKWSVANPVEEK